MTSYNLAKSMASNSITISSYCLNNDLKLVYGKTTRIVAILFVPSSSKEILIPIDLKNPTLKIGWNGILTSLTSRKSKLPSYYNFYQSLVIIPRNSATNTCTIITLVILPYMSLQEICTCPWFLQFLQSASCPHILNISYHYGNCILKNIIINADCQNSHKKRNKKEKNAHRGQSRTTPSEEESKLSHDVDIKQKIVFLSHNYHTIYASCLPTYLWLYIFLLHFLHLI